MSELITDPSKMVPVDFSSGLERFKELRKDEEQNGFESDELITLRHYLLEHSNFRHPLDRSTAEYIISKCQEVKLDSFGGWPQWVEKSFTVNGEEYTVIAWGVTGQCQSEDKYAFQPETIVFVKEG